jgi:hypothetical protein
MESTTTRIRFVVVLANGKHDDENTEMVLSSSLHENEIGKAVHRETRIQLRKTDNRKNMVRHGTFQSPAT